MYPGWMVFAILLLLFDFDIPPRQMSLLALDRKRKVLGVILFIIVSRILYPSATEIFSRVVAEDCQPLTIMVYISIFVTFNPCSP